MKLRYGMLFFLLCCCSFCWAQSDSLFEKYAQMEDVSQVYISKTMFQMMPAMETAGLNLVHMKGKIESLQILSTENEAKKVQMRKDFSGLIGKQHEALMRVKDGKTQATFYISRKGERIQELIMLADTKSNFSVIQLLGNFSMEDIQRITEDTKK